MKRPSRDFLELIDWIMMISLIVQWLFNTFNASIINSAPYMVDAKDLWTHLKKGFFIGYRPRIYELKDAVGNCRQHGISVFDYYG